MARSFLFINHVALTRHPERSARFPATELYRTESEKDAARFLTV
jgi:hypothetical protein